MIYGNELTCAKKKLIPRIASSRKDTFPLSISESGINKFQSTVQTGEKAEWNKGNALGQNDHSLS